MTGCSLPFENLLKDYLFSNDKRCRYNIYINGWQVVWLPVLKRCISAVTGISKIFNSEQCGKFKPYFAPESTQGTLCQLAWVD